jgi:tetratricopeptide (TPR) repeat protein
MNRKVFTVIFFLFLVAGFPGISAGEVKKPFLTVEKVVFTRAGEGTEAVAFTCSGPCEPTLFTLDEKNPRVVMDFKDVRLFRSNKRNLTLGGKLIKKVRSYLDRKTHRLRIVLDLDPLKDYVVRPVQTPFSKRYVLTITDASSLPAENRGIKTGNPADRRAHEKRIAILIPELEKPEKPEKKEQKEKIEQAVPEQVHQETAEDENYRQSIEQGRLFMNAGNFAAARDIFTRTIESRPLDSLSYRLRGNAHENLGERASALDDWINAAKLGDTIAQSYLDFLKVKWH